MSKRLNVPAHTLRYWEKQFPSAIKPTTGAGGRRYYRSETVDKLHVIKDLLYTHGMTIDGVKKMLRDGNLPDSANQISVENIPWYAIFIINALIPAIAEELMFRGLIFKNNKPLGELFAIIISGLFFGLWHQNLPQVCTTAFMGMFLCFIYLRTKSIFPCMVAHFFNN